MCGVPIAFPWNGGILLGSCNGSISFTFFDSLSGAFQYNIIAPLSVPNAIFVNGENNDIWAFYFAKLFYYSGATNTWTQVDVPSVKTINLITWDVDNNWLIAYALVQNQTTHLQEGVWFKVTIDSPSPTFVALNPGLLSYAGIIEAVATLQSPNSNDYG